VRSMVVWLLLLLTKVGTAFAEMILKHFLSTRFYQQFGLLVVMGIFRRIPQPVVKI
jgi:hypothetical protein